MTRRASAERERWTEKVYEPHSFSGSRKTKRERETRLKTDSPTWREERRV